MLEVRNIYKTYRKGGLLSGKRQTILTDVSFVVRDRECVGIIGESGSGKSTLGRQILGIEKPDSGEVLYNGRNVQDKDARRGLVSAVFQDYTSSVNPYFTVEDAIEEPLRLNGMQDAGELKRTVADLLEQVGLNESFAGKYSHELSGGEAQRVCIARAISTQPEFLLLDEAISSLDASVQWQILLLLKELKKKYGLSYLFITHDIQAAAYLCDRLIFFYQGKVAETAEVSALAQVKEEYSRKLLAAVLSL